MGGSTQLPEAMVRARGDGGDRQSAATDVILVSGNGGILGHHGTLVVSPHRSEPGSGRSARDAARKLGQADATTGQGGPGTTRASTTRECATRESGGNDAVTARSLAGPEDVGVIPPDTREPPFFAAAADGVLMIKRCGGCRVWLAPTASGRPRCGREPGLVWAAGSGRGALGS